MTLRFHTERGFVQGFVPTETVSMFVSYVCISMVFFGGTIRQMQYCQ